MLDCLLSSAVRSAYCRSFGGMSRRSANTLSSRDSVGSHSSGPGMGLPDGRIGIGNSRVGWLGSGRAKEQVRVKMGVPCWVARTVRVE